MGEVIGLEFEASLLPSTKGSRGLPNCHQGNYNTSQWPSALEWAVGTKQHIHTHTVTSVTSPRPWLSESASVAEVVDVDLRP